MQYSYLLPKGEKITVEAGNKKEAVSLVHQRIDPAQIEEVLAENVKEDSATPNQRMA